MAAARDDELASHYAKHVMLRLTPSSLSHTLMTIKCNGGIWMLNALKT
jgi:hypothetical protein